MHDFGRCGVCVWGGVWGVCGWCVGVCVGVWVCVTRVTWDTCSSFSNISLPGAASYYRGTGKYPGIFQYPGFIDKYPGIWQPVKYPGKWQLMTAETTCGLFRRISGIASHKGRYVLPQCVALESNALLSQPMGVELLSTRCFRKQHVAYMRSDTTCCFHF